MSAVLVLAHAGHYLVQLIYLVPLLVLVGVIIAGRRRDRREAAERAAAEPGGADSPRDPASGRKLREDPPR